MLEEPRVPQSYTVGLRRASQKRWYPRRALFKMMRKGLLGAGKQHVQRHRGIKQHRRLSTPGWLERN